MKLLSLFSGIGAFEKALDRLKVSYELVAYCEIDKFASKSYAAIHNVSESLNLGDITMINEKALPKDTDLICYGFPCQDISTSGKQKGFFDKDGTKTRSGLFFDALRIIEETKPRVAIAENVKNLTSKRFSEEFKIVLDSLEAAGYNNYFKVLGAKDFGIPQNRERVFIISIRKDIDSNQFQFPNGFPLELKLLDMLEEEVEEKYFINTDSANSIIKHVVSNFDVGNIEIVDKSINNPEIKEIANCITSRENRGISNRKAEGTAVLVREATKKGYAEAYEGDSINLEFPNSKTRRGRVGKQVAQTITTSPQQVVIDGHRLRNLTPKECFRLMGFDDESFHKAEAVNSNAQLYKQAGNSIVVDVLYYIFEELFKAGVLRRTSNENNSRVIRNSRTSKEENNQKIS